MLNWEPQHQTQKTLHLSSTGVFQAHLEMQRTQKKQCVTGVGFLSQFDQDPNQKHTVPHTATSQC